MKILTIILTFLLCIFSSKFFAQTNSKDSLSISKDSSIYVFETTDGNQFSGTIVEEDKEKIVVNTKNFGIINIKKSVLERKYIVEAKNIINNTYLNHFRFISMLISIMGLKAFENSIKL